VASALVQSRRRAYELAALRTAGVGDGELRGASLREYLVLLGAGSVCGFASGIAAALQAGPSVGLLGITATPPPTALTVGAPLMAAMAVAVFVLFGLVAVICARISMTFSRPELLREAPA
jgi:hypothetical protein